MRKLGNVTITNERVFGGVKVVEFAINGERNYALVTSSEMTRNDLYEALKSLGVEYVNKIPLKKGVVRPCVMFGMVIKVKGLAIDRVGLITMDEECLVNKIREKYKTWVDGNSGFAARNYLRVEFCPKKKKIVNWKIDDWDNEVEKKVVQELEKVSDECCIVEKFFKFSVGSQMIYFLQKEEIEVDDYTPLQADIDKFEEECERELAEAG